MSEKKLCMRIMTSNIWGDYFGNSPIGRDRQLLDVYEKYAPDVIGMQEATWAWYGCALMPELEGKYHIIGRDVSGEANNFVPMAISKQFTLIDKGYERLEDTPDISKAITWCVAERDGRTVAFCNTHFWWMKGNEDVVLRRNCGVEDFSLDDHNGLRQKNANQMARLMKRIFEKYSCPVFAFGDMNSTIEEGVFSEYAENGINKLFDLAEERDETCSIHGDPKRDENGVYRGVVANKEYIKWFRNRLFLREDESLPDYFTSIDHIVSLGDGFTVKQYRIVEDQGALDATDHSPVYADVELS